MAAGLLFRDFPFFLLLFGAMIAMDVVKYPTHFCVSNATPFWFQLDVHELVVA
jgi:hypothetical protein